MLRKIYWALEATIVTMGRPPGAVAVCSQPRPRGSRSAKPGAGPRRHRGAGCWPRCAPGAGQLGYLGADRGYTQCRPEHFHLPVRALGYSLVMDYKAAELGRQANSQGAVMVDGAFYCPAMPEDLVSASADKRAGNIDEATYKARISARAQWRLVRKAGPDQDGYERFACPAQGEHPHLCCPLRPQANALGKVPVLSPPAVPPKVCTQSAVTIAPDIGARHRQDLAFGIRGLGSHLRHLPQHHRGLERLRERHRPRSPGRTRAPAGAGHRRPEHLRSLVVNGGQLQEDRRFSPTRRRRHD